MAEDITSNINITTYDGNAILATDYGTSGTGVTAAHIQLAKLAWGSESITKRVSESFPLPVYLYGTTGSAAIGITGTVTGTVTAELELVTGTKAERQDILADVITGSLDREQKQIANKFDNLFGDVK